MAEKKETKIEREYTIPLRDKCRPVPRYKKTNKAVKTVKEFLARHMKIRDRDLKKIKLDLYLNEALWFRGIRNPPHKIKVKVIKEGDIVRVYAVDLPTKINFKKIREDKKSIAHEKLAKEVKESKKSMMEKAKEGLQAGKEDKDKNKDKEAPKSVPSKVETESKDKDKDGVEDKVEEKEKQKAVEETEKKEEKKEVVKKKHTTKVKKEGQPAEQVSEK